MMKAVVIENYGGSEVFAEQECDIPHIRDTQVLVEMRATTVSSADQLIRSGTFRQFMPTQFPHVLGVDIAGIVVATGKKVTRVQTGDRVLAVSRTGGGYAEYVAVEECDLAVIPQSLSDAEAASLSASGMTAWLSLFHYGKLQPGQRILIHAGAGGVGHLAIQLAKQHGAYVITTAQAHNHPFVLQLGADEVIDYTTTDFAETLSPVDVVLDMVRDPDVDKVTGIGVTELKNYNILKDNGTFISLVNPAIAKHPLIRGIDAQFALITPGAGDWEAFIQWIQTNKLDIHVDHVFPFTGQGVAEAHEYYDTRNKRGKLVIQRDSIHR
ncbi:MULTISPECIES: NADP-dependent oxidoreductase [Paenibacillus]|jgi:NADPH:quinone reductase-like Zn-dependent oxidoreductase|uniref:NADP-dependent oxidoreductase n=1 Tax=Paenibacillus TaxID=44249 RepID=UPI0020352D2A|nr:MULTISPECIES: NADP-dependent oxidoreductase [Paenibacillus]